MNKGLQPIKKIQSTRTTEQQKQINNLAIALGQLFGAEIAPKETVDKLSKEKTLLLKKTKDLEKAKDALMSYYCKFLSFLQYHSKWKPTTRQIEKRTKKLLKEKLFIRYNNVPIDIKENLEESYKCFIHGQEISCYLMLLRTVEITINHIYDPIQNPNKEFIPAKRKLDWISKNGLLSGADYFVMKGFIEGRNEAIHTVYKPTEKQLFSAMETVVNLIKTLDKGPAANNVFASSGVDA
jgi:hypothetical protein